MKKDNTKEAVRLLTFEESKHKRSQINPLFTIRMMASFKKQYPAIRTAYKEV